ncbi:AAA family ATPase [Bradyrhizobium sp. Pear76]|uniref:AAA family ATPase n=1 Tax=Bradyrhizobium oropedii TaxID=1571201 RepID=UPI001E59CEE5|nr:AAA family ATPase [Bradyrhizobium oropedii]MCC8964895.1 AAA family ATPase [Bradyrhizobium oropedii]
MLNLPNRAMGLRVFEDLGYVQRPPVEDIPPVESFDAFGEAPADPAEIEPDQPKPSAFAPITPAAWKDTEAEKQRWLVTGRIPSGDLTILAGNGGSGKTEISTQLLVSVAAGLGDWLGSIAEAGPALFLSCEEPESNVRDRVERICKHRCVDPHGLADLHMLFPDLEETWLAHAGKDGRLSRAPLLDWLEAWIKDHRPRLVVIDSIAAVFDGEAIARRQVRAFLAMLRKIAREHDTAIVLLDHPSVRGMADGSGTANSVDWRNSVRSMLHLSDPDKDDQDVRTLEVKKSNYGRSGEKVTLRWGGLTFTTAMAGEASLYRAAADRDVEEVFLKLLDKRQAQHRPVHAKNAKGSAPTEFAADPEAGGISAAGFRAAMERMLSNGRIKVVISGPASRRREHLERAGD